MYEVKGRIDEAQSAVHWIVEDAADIAEAMKAALDRGMYEIYAIHLSKVKEVFERSGGVWYKASVKEERQPEPTQGDTPEGMTPRRAASKPQKVTYEIMIKAVNLNDASEFVKEQMRQGYDFEVSSLRETKVDDIFSIA